MLTWTNHKPSKPGWYWMLNPGEESGLPTIVQIISDWQTGRALTLIPAANPQASGMVQEVPELDALWDPSIYSVIPINPLYEAVTEV